MRQLRHITAGLLTAVVLGSVEAQTRLPALSRQPVHGTPLICGKKIEQFVLLQSADFTPSDHFSADPLHGFQKGLFLPVSEDAHGVFFHGSNGVVVGRPYPPYEHESATGGIYVSKTKPGLAYGYLGDARKPAVQLTVMSERLRKDVLAKFLIGHSAPPGKK
ncbi:MAG TPA: hypothetical protein VEX43_15805 [Chthoniobacterales bacterium]|nr:hypothetical protein [Chthoniobacterales bacterium]